MNGRPGTGGEPSGLRTVVLGAAALSIVAGLFLAHYHGAPFAWLVVEGLVVLVAVLFERRRRYRGKPGGGLEGQWEATAEVFTDPVTGERLRVFYNRRTGARRYDPEAAAEPRKRP